MPLQAHHKPDEKLLKRTGVRLAECTADSTSDMQAATRTRDFPVAETENKRGGSSGPRAAAADDSRQNSLAHPSLRVIRV
jgi:hypothetical protein